MESSLVCPKCNSHKVRRSRTDGLKEELLKKLGYRAYRCGAKECQWRWLIKTGSARKEFKEFLKGHRKSLLAFLLAIVLIGLVWRFLSIMITR